MSWRAGILAAAIAFLRAFLRESVKGSASCVSKELLISAGEIERAVTAILKLRLRARVNCFIIVISSSLSVLFLSYIVRASDYPSYTKLLRLIQLGIGRREVR